MLFPGERWEAPCSGQSDSAASSLWVILGVTLGVMTLRNGHGWMCFFGIFFPILWIFGAFMGRP